MIAMDLQAYYPKSHLSLLIIIFCLFPYVTISTSNHTIPLHNKCLSSCGDIHKITFPFRLETDPPDCGSEFGGYTLSCKKNRTIFTIKNQTYYVKSINYDNYTIRVASPNVLDNKNNCSSVPNSSLSTEDIPRNSFYSRDFVARSGEISQNPEGLESKSCENKNFSFTPLFNHLAIVDTKSYYIIKADPKLETFIRFEREKKIVRISESLIFLRCEKAVINNPLYTSTSPCINNSDSNKDFSYVVFGNGFKFSDIEESCEIVRSTLVSSPAKGQTRRKVSSYHDVHAELVHGFELSWVQAFEGGRKGDCYVDEVSNMVHCPKFSGFRQCLVILEEIYKIIILAVNAKGTYGLRNYQGWLIQRSIALVFVMGLVVYTWKRRHRSEYANIEAFLRSSNNQMPLRYTYSEIQKMARGFTTKLGQGGFGFVYKAKLHNGRPAAIKVLRRSKDAGQDFINEVETIGRIHHVNVVRLVGFCIEGSKRALVYDFMPNGSLDKYIFSKDDTSNLISREKMFEIALGIARGIEYLHRGCGIQILHFDIKPHNILLDENFVPKISDFGLARSCPSNKSMESLTAARGTIGYIAPELFYKNIGGVSHKSDVYSFGMLLMEMANRRRNLNASAANSSDVFVPCRVYDEFKKEITLELGSVKKMIIVALWCIQLKPSDRPSMKEVIEMLEGDVVTLEMPPKPDLYPRYEENGNSNTMETSRMWNTTSLLARLNDDDSDEISLIP